MRDRTGDELDEAPAPHDPRCVDKWIDRDGDNPQPCLTCKPHLRPKFERRHHA
ncbi:hypothetical protein ACFXG4_27315 [Nocardia sp. NPDC059246]|uniref:hypothetical protein n=1 Tax=unclassified Nocardia TaxID=2637762 RepID=UPI0036A43EC9